MLGIAHIIKNRVDAGWESGDWFKVLYNVPVHSANNITDMDFRSLPDLWDASFRWLYSECERVYDGALDTVTVSADPRKVGGRGMPQRALFYASLQNLTRDWFTEKIIKEPSHQPTATAGTVTFFT